MPQPKSRIGEILSKKGIVDAETLERAEGILEQEDGKRKLTDILVSDFGIDHHAVFSEVSRFYAFKELNLDEQAVDDPRLEFIKGILDKLTPEIVEKIITRKMLPFKVSEDQKDLLLIITPDPTDKEVSSLSRHFPYKKHEILYTRLNKFDTLLEKVVPPKNEFLEIVEKQSQPIEVSEEEGAEEPIDKDTVSALRALVEASLIEAVRKGASDIHVVPHDSKSTEIHFRIDGNLQLWRIDPYKPEAVSAVIKDFSKNVDRFEREIAQDGFIQKRVDDQWIRYRVSILPIVGSEFRRKWESIVVRVLDDRNVVTEIERLGFLEKALSDFKAAISAPQGIIILTGPTGCGKSTTLMAALHHVMDPTVNVLTVEDPVEFLIKGARQLKIGNKMNFDQAIRSILRHDPDIVMVGEIRDLKTAEIAIKLANTGHLTFSTLHTNDAPSSVTRLYTMGVEPFLIANAINVIIAQRLVRTLCSKCKAPAKTPDVPAARRLGLSDEEIKSAVFYEPVGCPECNKGWKGRAAIHEGLLFTKEIRKIISSSKDTVDETAIKEQAKKTGVLTLRESGAQKAKEGITTIEEIISATVEE
ncbi:MAG: GspE/PulE family protein [Candidatus Eisenbacteria bacterium]|nr:GspE/PulE family protein [Candidatus Eisenbacteria bacterium]